MTTERQKTIEYLQTLERTIEMTKPPGLIDKELRAILGHLRGVIKIELYHQLRRVEKL
jgi:hypothetical protein